MPVLKGRFPQTNFDDFEVTLFTITNRGSNRLSVKIIDYGATIVSILFQDFGGSFRDLVLGFDDLQHYLGPNNRYFGSTIGRVANRIGNGASFELNNCRYSLAVNNGPNHLHGGLKGFDKRKWTLIDEDDSSIVLQLVSEDGDEQYPGSLLTTVRFTVTQNDELKIEYQAKLLSVNEPATTKTIVNLTNHSYFNLAGAHNAESVSILDHQVKMNAKKFLPVDQSSIPLGQIDSVIGTSFDFYSESHSIGKRMKQIKPNGYDHCYVLEDQPHRWTIDTLKQSVPVEAARIYSPYSKIRMIISTSEPAFQFYVSGWLKPESIQPKSSQTTNPQIRLGQFSGVCFEAQRFPNAINKKEWQSQVILAHDQKYTQTTVYKFELSNSID